MNVFEDLIEALKEENLLESTVIDGADISKGSPIESAAEPGEEATVLSSVAESADPRGFEAEPISEDRSGKVPSPREFYRKRATDEVSSLQMVEHILSGVEREHMKIVSTPFNDLKVKQALHRFTQLSDSTAAEESAQAEFDLLHQSQSWFTALSDRDRDISVGNLRRFVEDSKPALSSQAMLALARFYRNSPFTETTRNKFDFVMTRLFSRESEGEQRRLLFAFNDMIGHIKTLYDNWSSIEVFTQLEHSREIAESAARFKQFVAEVEEARSLEQLIATNFFDRIRVFKDELGELFFAREVMAAAIDCNIRVGNRFVELVAAARKSDSRDRLEERFGEQFDQVVSNTTGRTILLSDLLRSDQIADVEKTVNDIPVQAPQRRVQTERKSPVSTAKSRFSLRGVNKWLVAATLLVSFVCVGAYLWADNVDGGDSTVKKAAAIDIAATELKQHLEKARASNETFYGVTAPSWDALSQDDKEEFLRKVTEYAGKQGLTKVNLLNYRGRTVAFANKDRFEILPPT